MTRIYIIIILVVLLLLSGGFGFWAFKKWREETFQNKQLVAFSADKDKVVQHYLNKYKQEVVKNEAQQFTNKTLKEMVEEGAIKLDQFKKVKAKQVEGMSWINIVALDTGHALVKPDGSFEIDQQFNKISGEVKVDNGITSIAVKDSTQVPLTVVVYWHRTWFMARKEYDGEAVSDNPNVKISKLKLIVKKK